MERRLFKVGIWRDVGHTLKRGLVTSRFYLKSVMAMILPLIGNNFKVFEIFDAWSADWVVSGH